MAKKFVAFLKWNFTYASIHVVLEIIVETSNLVTKLIKFRNDQIISKHFYNERQVQFNNRFELIKCQSDAFQRRRSFRLKLVKLIDDGFKSWVSFGSNSSSFYFLFNE